MSVNGILGKKVGMTQLFDDKGEVHPITVLQAGPCVVTQKKSQAKEGYDAVQIGLIEFVKESRLTKPERGHLSKHNLPPVRFLREVGITADGAADAATGAATLDAVKVGDKVLVDIFQDEKYVDVTGTSKGRGFAGVVKRHHFRGGPRSHGSMFQIPGSIGASAFPSRVLKGMRMSGHLGNARVTTRNLRVVGIDLDENLLMVQGAVPGPNGGYVLINKTVKPPREHRGFGGEASFDPLKAGKRKTKKA